MAGYREVITVTPNPAIDWTLTVPEFRAGAVNRVREEHSQPGGKGVNVAAALADYGQRVAATGFLGRDNAAAFESYFAAKQITDAFIRVPGTTRVGIKVVDPQRQQTTDINFPGLSIAAHEVAALLEKLDELTETEQPWCVLSGSLPPGAEPALYRQIAERLRSRGCLVAVDASGEALRHALEAAPEVVKPNLAELEALLGRSLSSPERRLQAAQALLARGVRLAVVSLGAEGALFVEQGSALLARPPNVSVGSTVGAGDAMVAGIIAGRLRGLTSAVVARLASAFSLHALTRPGGEGFSPPAVDALIDRIRLDEV
jgi:1-phosphofructokinase